MKKLLLTVFSLATLTLAACGNQVASVDISERLETKPAIAWGVKTDTRLFGLTNIATGNIEGFDIDIAKALTTEIAGKDATASFVEVTSKTRIPLLKNGNIDAIIATMSITPDRQKIVDFSDVYFDGGQSLLVKKGSPIKSVTDLNEKTTVLAVKGSTSAVNIRKLAPKAKILELENYSEAFTALKSKQGDAMTTDSGILYGMVAQDNSYAVVGGNFTDEPYGIAVNKGQEAFVKDINTALVTLKKNGTYQKIYDKWIPEND
ncbi:transporter substrate-binding domain-containing protein [Brochothrix campestris]|uniref:Bacterial extracellular solute-binding s, 3 family protein n=1 Tax=Brochothrix campestris FSL F6-1037 TaxID=1265861 RepID=W7D2M1_9LIST|nr:transporter substrate-binding domain-containing protein [Brochothrix campestris]EUJ42151.1 bacterial extracellular solute-binding s, 3 family protein [Brochothrix campestris FSL F6-1037]